MRANGFGGGDFHEADHRRRGENGGKVRIVGGDGPLKLDDALDGGFEADGQIREMSGR